MSKKEELEKELKETRALLFLAVRNTTVLPKGLLLGKSEEDISAMTLATIEEMKKKADYKPIEILMSLGEKNGNADNQQPNN